VAEDVDPADEQEPQGPALEGRRTSRPGLLALGGPAPPVEETDGETEDCGGLKRAPLPQARQAEQEQDRAPGAVAESEGERELFHNIIGTDPEDAQQAAA